MSAARTTPDGGGPTPGVVAPRSWWDRDPDGPLVLAIDSSSQVGSIAILRADAVVAEASWTARRPGGSMHLDVAAGLMRDLDLSPSSLQAVAVATGPGSFTGTRAGISAGQGIAGSLGIPLVGVPTLEALAAQLAGRATPGDVSCAIVAAGRGAVHAWASVVAATPGARGAALGAPVTASIEEVANALASLVLPPGSRVIVGGELDRLQGRTLRSVLPDARIPPPAVTQRRAAWLAMLARPMIDDALGAGAPPSLPEDVQPLYLSMPSGARRLDLGWRIPS